jgi:8-oxo-dGTP pyrophosphatase MutT (NUDIX family)
MSNAWRILSSRPVIRDRWIDLRADRCVTPNGVEISPYYVLTYPDWVNVVALTPERDLVLVRQYRHAVAATVLELPGGVMDSSDDNPEQAARRELLEETGFTAKRWLTIGSLSANPATHTNRIHSFLALDATPGDGQALDHGEEGLATCLMPLDEVVGRLDAGLIDQAMHVAAVLLATRLLARL